MAEPTYTYRAGERFPLTKSDSEFVVRVLPMEASALGLEPVMQVSSASTKVVVAADQLDDQMAAVRQQRVAHHLYLTEDGAEFLITDRTYVRFRSDLAAEDLVAFTLEYALVPLDSMFDDEHLFQLTDATGMNPVKLVQRLTEDDDRVLLAENDVNYRTTIALDAPADPLYRYQWHLHTLTTHPMFSSRASVRCDDAWQLLNSFGDPNVVIGISDDGCRLDHADFDSPDKFAAWGYFQGSRLVRSSDVDAVPSLMYQAGANHGTGCAGVAAGETDGKLTVGAAPACRLLPIKFESDGPWLFISDSKLRKALDFVADKVDVLSNSWGGGPIDVAGAQVIERIRQLQTAGGRRGTGIVFLWAAGNENRPIDHVADVDVPYDDGWDVSSGLPRWVGPRTTRIFQNTLVGLPGVLHIGALGSDARRSHYSNYGPGVDLCAPSSNRQTYAKVALGLSITTARGASPFDTRGDFGGTSSATPTVAGVAALVISANPTLPAAEVISILQRSASRDLDASPWPRTPPSTVMGNDTSWDVSPIPPFDDGSFVDIDHEDGTWSPWFGFGRIDAAAAVAAAMAAGGGTPNGSWVRNHSGHLDATGDRDVYHVEFAGTMTAELVGPADADFDLHLVREEPSQPPVAARSTGVTSLESLTVQATVPEKWRISVVSWRGSGDYGLHVEVRE